MEKVPYFIIIPARLKSTRLPNKPLIDLMGKSMIQRTYDRCIQAAPKNQVVIATDSKEIFMHCKERNMNAEITSQNCLTGTDRVADLATKLNSDYFINVQGDEPLINPDDIKLVISKCLKNNKIIFNGYTKIYDSELFFSSSTPKVVFNKAKKLMYMSRAPIPGNKNNEFNESFRQVCIYGFPKWALQKFKSQSSKTQFENIEDIEILRFLELGFEVEMLEMSNESIPVDYPEDVKKVIAKLENEK